MSANLKIKIDQIVRLFSLFRREKFLNCLIRLRIPSIEDDVYIFQNYSKNCEFNFILHMKYYDLKDIYIHVYIVKFRLKKCNYHEKANFYPPFPASVVL